MESKPIVTDGRTLRGMARQGYIVWSSGTERHWTGTMVPIVNVSEGPRLKSCSQPFTYRGQSYRLRYFDGCFKPFVTLADATQFPRFV